MASSSPRPGLSLHGQCASHGSPNRAAEDPAGAAHRPPRAARPQAGALRPWQGAGREGGSRGPEALSAGARAAPPRPVPSGVVLARRPGGGTAPPRSHRGARLDRPGPRCTPSVRCPLRALVVHRAPGARPCSRGRRLVPRGGSPPGEQRGRTPRGAEGRAGTALGWDTRLRPRPVGPAGAWAEFCPGIDPLFPSLKMAFVDSFSHFRSNVYCNNF